MRRGADCVQPSLGRPPRVYLASHRGFLSLPCPMDPFGLEFLPIRSSWCMLLCKSLEHVFSPLRGASCTTLPSRWRPQARMASPDRWKGSRGGVVPKLGFPHLLSAFFVAQERGVEESWRVAGRVVLPPDRDDEGRVVHELSQQGRCLDSPSPLLHYLADHKFIYPRHG